MVPGINLSYADPSCTANALQNVQPHNDSLETELPPYKPTATELSEGRKTSVLVRFKLRLSLRTVPLKENFPTRLQAVSLAIFKR